MFVFVDEMALNSIQQNRPLDYSISALCRKNPSLRTLFHQRQPCTASLIVEWAESEGAYKLYVTEAMVTHSLEHTRAETLASHCVTVWSTLSDA